MLVSCWLPKASVKLTWKFFGGSALKLTVASRPLSLVTLTLYLKDVVAVPRSAGKFVVIFSLAGSSSPTVTLIGSFSSYFSFLASTVNGKYDEKLPIKVTVGEELPAKL